MSRVLSVNAERYPIAGTFTISRGSKTEAEVLTVEIREVPTPVVASAFLIGVMAKPSKACAWR